MLPKYLIADNSLEKPGKVYVVHTEAPRFILEGNDEDFSEEQIIHWLDTEITDHQQLDNLIEAAEKFLDTELDNQEDLYDDLISPN
ncbi:MAG: hypothetical protein PF517_12055 [Salinivirgaceae bacterium]|jgi:hypothetical protein|nr:hypothetical protein [Salinivirgaceae bacterium]